MIKNSLKYFVFFVFLTTNMIHGFSERGVRFDGRQDIPWVEPVFCGLLGNNLFAFCIGKIIAKELGFNLCTRPIWGFPHTYLYQNKPSNKYPVNLIMGQGPYLRDINIQEISSNHSLRNIKLQGFFHKYEYLRRYKEQIRNEWLKIDSSIVRAPQDPDDIVVHIRTTPKQQFFLPFEYYEKALSLATYNRVFICIDEPGDPFLENFKKYNPIVVSTRSITQLLHSMMPWDEISKLNFDDFVFIHSFNKIVISHSTYCWWAAFLSDAEEIYAPDCSNPETYKETYGKIDETRYHYIHTPIGIS